MTHTFLARLHYAGGGFVGWQRQAKGRTVQAEVERVLERLSGRRIVAHGAGRKMTRSEAVAKLKDRYKRKELRGAHRVLCDDNALLYEEHPDAYKAIEPVIGALETHGQATRVAALAPVVTVKL